MGGQGGPAQADDARVLHDLHEVVQGQGAPVRAGAPRPGAGSRRGRPRSRWPGSNRPPGKRRRADGPHPAGDRAVQAGGDEGAGLGDALLRGARRCPALHHRLGRCPQVLVQGQHVAVDERHALGRQVPGQGLVLVRVHAVGEAAPNEGIGSREQGQGVVPHWLCCLDGEGPPCEIRSSALSPLPCPRKRP